MKDQVNAATLVEGIVCLHSVVKQSDFITPENRLYDDGSAAASSITYINSQLIIKV